MAGALSDGVACPVTRRRRRVGARTPVLALTRRMGLRSVLLAVALLLPIAPPVSRADARHDVVAPGTRVQPGITVLLRDRLDLIRGKRIGLITNATGVDRRLVSDVSLLADAPGVHLVALFGPEHGIHGAHQAGRQVGSERDPATGVPVYSLYGEQRAPTAAMLAGVDALVFDIQPVGTRFYTYLYTMADAMRAAAKANIPFIVLDRPDPIGAVRVEGPVLEPNYASFVGQYPIALRYGMTVGELARMFNDAFGIKARLTVVRMRGYRRSMYYDETGLPFVMPSPNMPTIDTALVYPGMALVEGTNVSEGRGTTRPFQLIGAPWIDAHVLVRAMRALHLPGVLFRAAYFTPTFSKYREQSCAGIEIYVVNRNTFDPVVTGLTLIKTIHDLYPHEFKFKVGHFDHLIGNSWVREGIEHGMAIDAMRRRWQVRLDAFRRERRKYLLY